MSPKKKNPFKDEVARIRTKVEKRGKRINAKIPFKCRSKNIHVYFFCVPCENKVNHTASIVSCERSQDMVLSGCYKADTIQAEINPGCFWTSRPVAWPITSASSKSVPSRSNLYHYMFMLSNGILIEQEYKLIFADQFQACIHVLLYNLFSANQLK